MLKFSPSPATLFALTMMFAGAAFAQSAADPSTDGDRPHAPRLQRLVSDLGLSDAQREQVAAIMERHRADRGASDEQRKAARQAMRSEIEAVLTPEQREKLRTQQLERRDRVENGRERRANRDRRSGPPRSPGG